MELKPQRLSMSDGKSTASLRCAFLGSLALHAITGIWLLRHTLDAIHLIPPLPLQVRLASVIEPAAAMPRTIVAPPSVEHKPSAGPHREATRRVAAQMTRQADQEASPASFNAPPPTDSSPATSSSTAATAGSAPQFSAAYLNNPAPDYPAVARRRRLQGTTVLDVRVSIGGRPASISISRSSGVPDLDEAAREAVRGWTFVPAKLGNNPIEGRVEVPIRFRLND